MAKTYTNESSRDNNGHDASLHKQYTITDEVHLYAFFIETLLLEYKM